VLARASREREPVITGVKPGDLLCVRSPGLAGKLIRIGEEMAGQPGLDNHVA
jgi:hypothetical protein